MINVQSFRVYCLVILAMVGCKTGSAEYCSEDARLKICRKDYAAEPALREFSLRLDPKMDIAILGLEYDEYLAKPECIRTGIDFVKSQNLSKAIISKELDIQFTMDAGNHGCFQRADTKLYFDYRGKVLCVQYAKQDSIGRLCLETQKSAL